MKTRDVSYIYEMTRFFHTSSLLNGSIVYNVYTIGYTFVLTPSVSVRRKHTYKRFPLLFPFPFGELRARARDAVLRALIGGSTTGAVAAGIAATTGAAAFGSSTSVCSKSSAPLSSFNTLDGGTDLLVVFHPLLRMWLDVLDPHHRGVRVLVEFRGQCIGSSGCPCSLGQYRPEST